MPTTKTQTPRIQPAYTDDAQEIANAAASAATVYCDGFTERGDGGVDIDLSCYLNAGNELGIPPTLVGRVCREFRNGGFCEAEVFLRLIEFRWDGSSPVYTYCVHKIKHV